MHLAVAALIAAIGVELLLPGIDIIADGWSGQFSAWLFVGGPFGLVLIAGAIWSLVLWANGFDDWVDR